jgi:hypothetical protein
MIAFLIIGVFALLLWETGWELGLIHKKTSALLRRFHYNFISMLKWLKLFARSSFSLQSSSQLQRLIRIYYSTGS